MSMEAPVVWSDCTLEAMSPLGLYAALQLRSKVFVVEQKCLFLDTDGLDAQAVHLMGRVGGQLLANARCFPPGVAFAEASIGRIVTDDAARGRGIGHALVLQAKVLIQRRWGSQPIRIGAQARLQRFYEGHGFADVGKPYVEDGIDHLEMLFLPRALDTQ